MSIVRSRRFGRAALAAAAAVAVAVIGVGTAQAAANPSLWNQASSSGFPVGSQIYDSISLGRGVNPTGFLTFTLFGPDNATCDGPPIFTTTTEVNGNGYYESSRYVADAAGTYSWVAAYSGDEANNAPAPTPCDSSWAQVTVARRTPVLNVSQSWDPPIASATAVLSSGAGPAGPTGTMTFNLYGPANPTCAGLPVAVTSVPVTGNGSYVSDLFTPLAIGTYEWVVVYSGDANNVARSSTCSDTGNGFTSTTEIPVSTVVSGSPTTVNRGARVTVTWSGIVDPSAGDWVALYPLGTVDGGPVKAWKFTNGATDGSVTLKFPWGAAPGDYEIRLMADFSITRLATSEPISLVW